MHKVFAVTAAIPAASGSILPNSVVNRLAGGNLPIITEREIIIGHPSGVMDLKVDARFEKDGPRIVSCTVGRTDRKILDGRVYISAGVYVFGK